MLATLNELSAKITEVATAEINDFHKEAARTAAWKADQARISTKQLETETPGLPIVASLKTTELLSPLLNIVQQVSSAAHQRVNSEWQNFELEVARSEDWKREQEGKSARHVIEEPAIRRLHFGVDDGASCTPANKETKLRSAHQEDQVRVLLKWDAELQANLCDAEDRSCEKMT